MSSARLMRGAAVRSLHSTRALKASAEAAPASSEKITAKFAESDTFKKISKNNVFVLESATLNTWQEIPKGGIHGSDRTKAIWSIWYNHAVVPLYLTSLVAAGLCSWFLYRYFSRHTEIAWSKSMRGTFDFQGLDERRANAHDQRLLYPGMRNRNKREVVMFPFNFRPMHGACSEPSTHACQLGGTGPEVSVP